MADLYDRRGLEHDCSWRALRPPSLALQAAGHSVCRGLAAAGGAAAPPAPPGSPGPGLGRSPGRRRRRRRTLSAVGQEPPPRSLARLAPIDSQVGDGGHVGAPSRAQLEYLARRLLRKGDGDFVIERLCTQIRAMLEH